MPLGPVSSANIVRLQGVCGDQVQSALQHRGYRLGKTIGEGSYCKVRVAYKSYSNGYTRKCACKTIDRKRASKDFVTKFLPREMSIIKSIRHPHIVSILDIVDVDDQVYFFMDICERGDLLDYIRNKGPLAEARAKHFFKQLVSAVDYLHSLDISHRDLKCENILLASKDCVKIADFGFARWCRDEAGRRILSETFCGSAAYAAPEILQGTAYNPKMYDAWSLGCILYIMLTATMPFDDSNIKQMLKIQMSKRLAFPARCENISVSARKLVGADGILALQKGLVPAMWYQLCWNGVRLGIFQFAENRNWTKNKDGSISAFKCVVVGSVSGCAGAFAGNPLYLVKTQLQAKAAKQVAVGHQHSYTGMVKGVSSIYRQHGIASLYRGVTGAMTRATLGSGIQLMIFGYCKEKLASNYQAFQNNPLFNTFVSSMLGGIGISVAMTSFDVVMTRIYNQGVDSRGNGLLYNGVIDCFNKIWKSKGLYGFYKGFVPYYARVGPHSVLCLVFWDVLKRTETYYNARRQSHYPTKS